LDGEIMEMGGGFWVEIAAARISPSAGKPAGVAYSLCLIGPGDERLVCYDNAHPIRAGTGPGARRTVPYDHMHRRTTVKPYRYKNAEALLVDFWTDVERMLKERGVS
jgi:hypothetical protein